MNVLNRTIITLPRRVTANLTNTLQQGYRGNAGLAALLLCTLFVGGLGATLHPRLLLLLPALAMLFVVGAVGPWLTVLLLRGRLHFTEERIHEREDVHVSLKLRQRAPWPAWGVLLEVDTDNRQVLETAHPVASTETVFKFQPRQRGAFPQYPPRLQTGFPFGLVTASRRIAVNRPLVIWPQIFPVAPPPEWASADLAVGHVETRRSGSAGDTLGVREYRRGDPMRWIHWPQTARHDRFMVREFQASGVPRTRIVLDCAADVHVGTGSDSSFEWAVRITASLAVGWLAEGAEVELRAGSLHLPAAGGRRHQRLVLDALAAAQLHQPDSATILPESELATVFVSTDLGWAKRPEPACCSSCGFMLRNQGFGGHHQPANALRGKFVTIERPDDVPAALLRMKRGLADVA